MGRKQIAFKRPRHPQDKPSSDEGESQSQEAPAPLLEHETSSIAVDEDDAASDNVSQHMITFNPDADHPQTPAPGQTFQPTASETQLISQPTGGIVLGLRKLKEGDKKPTAAKSKRTRLASNMKESKGRNPNRRKLKTSKKGGVDTGAAVSEATSRCLILEWIEGQKSLTEDQKKLLRDNFEALGKSQVDEFERGFRKIRKAELQLIVRKTEIVSKFVLSVLNVIETQAS